MEKECQHHANCGGWAITDEELEFSLCEDCLEALFQDEKHIKAVAELRRAIEFLDMCRNDHESASKTGSYKDAREWLERAARAVVSS